MKNKYIQDKSNLFSRSLEGIGDVLVFETNIQKNKLVLDGLQKIRGLIEKLFAMQTNNLDRFEKIVFSKDFLVLYERDEEEAKLNLAFNTEKHMIGFSSAINQFIRVYKAAIESQNDEVSRACVYQIIWVLSELSKKPNNGLFIESILRKLTEITKMAIKYNDNSVYVASTRWYANIVFNSLGREENLDLTYLEIFDKYFLSSIRTIISDNHFYIYKELISNLIDNNDIYPNRNSKEIWTYAHLILQDNFEQYAQLNRKYDIENKILELDNLIEEITTVGKLDAWVDKFNALKEIIKSSFSVSQEQQAGELESEIKNFVISKFKYNNVLRIIYSVGAYCLFKQRPSYIKYLWEYKQPGDSDAIWGGHDIVPNSLDEVVKLYFNMKESQRKFDFWEGHHGNEKYLNEYFLLLLAKIMKDMQPGLNGEFSDIENYRLPDFNIYSLNDMNYEVDDFIRLAFDLKRQSNLFIELGFDINQLDELFERKLIPFLQRLKENVNEKISIKHRSGNVSYKKIDEFKKEAIDYFYKSATMRDIFINYLKSYDNKVKERVECETTRFGIATVGDKAWFFDEWHIHFGNLGMNYGKDLALGENQYLLSEFIQACQIITYEKFDYTLENMDNLANVIILAASASPILFFKGLNKFKPKSQIMNHLDIKGFEGVYEIAGQLIPVFEVPAYKGEHIFILNKSNLGQLVQFSPLEENDDEKLMLDIFYINIQEFSKNKELMQQFIEKPPEWLQKIGNAQKQCEHLEERVLIQILERFEYKKSQNFEGYRLSLKD